jgi:hypothetical protein
MPRINDQLFDCVFYLYPNPEAAADRERKEDAVSLSECASLLAPTSFMYTQLRIGT